MQIKQKFKYLRMVYVMYMECKYFM